jgi:hypothetical protein
LPALCAAMTTVHFFYESNHHRQKSKGDAQGGRQSAESGAMGRQSAAKRHRPLSAPPPLRPALALCRSESIPNRTKTLSFGSYPVERKARAGISLFALLPGVYYVPFESASSPGARQVRRIG